VTPEARDLAAAALRQDARTARPVDEGSTNPDATPGPRPRSQHGRRATLWLPQGDLVRPVAVVAGLTDGSHTEVESIDRDGLLKEGAEVVFGLAQAESEDDALAGNTPFLPRIDNKGGPNK
jgi:hypothetical protein